MVRVGLATQPMINLMRDELLDADLIGKALTYLREQWPKLILYIKNGN